MTRLLVILPFAIASTSFAADEIDFNRDIRPILSNACFQCHGPDDSGRQADLRLDTAQGLHADMDGMKPVEPGHPEKSAIVHRIESDDEFEVMPPPESGLKVAAADLAKLKKWIKQGGTFSKHWSYTAPVRHEPPSVQNSQWVRTPIDTFILTKHESLGMKPNREADRYTLVRRLSLDLTGLPPTVEEVDTFVNDKDPDAYENLVDRLLAKEAYGEHWARMWLDLARYADSAGYADDPPRTIWAYRDYVIHALNQNTPFDQFTIDQLAGDLLANPTEQQLVATAFHRNTMTNNEGGTNDEEFRDAAVVDRVNTTMAVWMATTINCCQCHNHKYDPISQKEYYELFAILNNTADADRRDESPTIELYTPEQRELQARLKKDIQELDRVLSARTPAIETAQVTWEARLKEPAAWRRQSVALVESRKKAKVEAGEHKVIIAEGKPGDTLTSEFSFSSTHTVSGLRLVVPPMKGGETSKITSVSAVVVPVDSESLDGRFIRIEAPGKSRILSLAEVQAFSNGRNVAVEGKAKQSSTSHDGPARLAIDGNTDGHYFNAKSTTHTDQSNDPWWEVDLGKSFPLSQVVVWNRTDGNVFERLSGANVKILDDDRQVVWEGKIEKASKEQREFALTGERRIPFATAHASREKKGSEASLVLSSKPDRKKGWDVTPSTNEPVTLSLIPSKPVDIPDGAVLRVNVEHADVNQPSLKKYAIEWSDDPRVSESASIPANVLKTIAKDVSKRSKAESVSLEKYYQSITPLLSKERQQRDTYAKQLANVKPYTTVPVFRELAKDKQRTTRIHNRGNFMDLGNEVGPGAPTTWHKLEAEAPTRLDLARWIVSPANPLTARVAVNRLWEKIFGIGLVSTSEEFGSQGEAPSHPKLLDWLATEYVRLGWDSKALLKLLVMSSTYRQGSDTTPEDLEADPDNRFLARGPRFRMTGEQIRDQALFISGLLSDKMYGPPVRPPQPSLGLNAAFGGKIDWQTSTGEDRYRRAIYTSWRRSSPYPSLTTFDAPNREVCAVRRDRTNTPLQALVTLNDPVFMEAAQALARRIDGFDGALKDKMTFAFRVCLARYPTESERERLQELYETSLTRFAEDATDAKMIATDPIGPAPKDANVAELAAWTIVGNVLLNLDETLMRL